MDVTSSLRSLLPYGRRSIGINQLIDKLEALPAPEDVERVQAAYDFAFQAHEGQRRRSGEPYITHPVAVADLLADLRLDAQTLIAAILHDVIEDTPTVKDEIADALRRARWRSWSTASASSTRSSSRAAPRRRPRASARCCSPWCATSASSWSSSPTARTTCARSASMPPAKRRSIARETLEIYAPIANRLGMNAIKVELEDLGLPRALPAPLQGHRDRGAQGARATRSSSSRASAATLEAALEKAQARRRASRAARRTCTASTRRCAARRSRSARSWTCTASASSCDDVDTCYRALGIVHGVYKPMPGPLQGLHRDPARQRLPVAAHHAVRPERHADRGADPHRGDAPRRRVRHRRALAVQGGRRLRPHAQRPRARVAAAAHGDPAGRQLRGVPRERQGRPVPGQGLRVHAEGRHPAACRAARPASTSPTPCTPTSATAASRPRSTAGWCRCARRCATARRSRSSPPRARRRTRPG